MTTFAPDTQFGKYRILRLLGQGGMADVYEAEDTTIGRKVALKILPLAFARDEERAKRFAKEIQACAQLDHPHIVSVFDVGEIDYLHYYSMSVLPGGELKTRLTEGALPPKLALRITKEIASALSYAHEKGFVHRDVKPENILFSEDGRAVLTDFGIARATTSSTRMTATGLSIGTPHYMSPEQARGKEVDGRSDLYALGVVLYEMLTGKVPFDATDSLAIGIMHLQDDPDPLPGIIRKYQPLLDGLLAKSPENRFQTGQHLVDEIDFLETGRRAEPVYSGQAESASGESRAKPRNRTRLTRRADRSGPESNAINSSYALRWTLGGAVLAIAVSIGLYMFVHEPAHMPVGGGASLAPVSETAPQATEPGSTEPLPFVMDRVDDQIREAADSAEPLEETMPRHRLLSLRLEGRSATLVQEAVEMLEDGDLIHPDGGALARLLQLYDATEGHALLVDELDDTLRRVASRLDSERLTDENQAEISALRALSAMVEHQLPDSVRQSVSTVTNIGRPLLLQFASRSYEEAVVSSESAAHAKAAYRVLMALSGPEERYESRLAELETGFGRLRINLDADENFYFSLNSRQYSGTNNHIIERIEAGQHRLSVQSQSTVQDPVHGSVPAVREDSIAIMVKPFQETVVNRRIPVWVMSYQEEVVVEEGRWENYQEFIPAEYQTITERVCGPWQETFFGGRRRECENKEVERRKPGTGINADRRRWVDQVKQLQWKGGEYR